MPECRLPRADGELCTDVGWSPGHRQLIALEWPGVGGKAIRELRTATHTTLVDPEWGRDNQFWSTLARAINYRKERTMGWTISNGSGTQILRSYTYVSQLGEHLAHVLSARDWRVLAPLFARPPRGVVHHQLPRRRPHDPHPPRRSWAPSYAS